MSPVPPSPPSPRDASPEAAAFARTRRATLATVFLTIFLDLVGFGMFIPILANVARELGASATEAAALSTWFSVGTLVSVLTLGRLSDRIGRRPVLVTTVALSFVAQLATAWVGHASLGMAALGALTLVRLVAGVAAGNISVAQACIADLTAPRDRARFMILIGLAFGSGFALGPALGAGVAHLWPGDTLVGVSLAAAALNLLNLAAVAWRLPETKGTRLPGSDAAPPPRAPQPWRLELRGLVATPGFAAVLAVQFLQVFSFVGVETILPMALRDAYALENTAIYGAFVVIGMSALVANGGLARPVLARLGEVRTLLTGQALLALGVLAIPMLAPDTRLLNVALVLLALGTGLSNPALSAIVSRLAPRESQGFALGAAQTLSAAARIAGPVTLGALYEAFHGARSLTASFLLLVVGGVVAGAGLSRARARFQADDAAPAEAPDATTPSKSSPTV